MRRAPAGRSRTILIIYVVIGIVVAAIRGYFDIDNVQDFISLLLAIALWPLVLLGVDLHVGGGGRRRRGLLLPAVGPALAYLRTKLNV